MSSRAYTRVMGFTRDDCLNASWDVASGWRRRIQERLAKHRGHAPTRFQIFVVTAITWTLFVFWFVRFRCDL